LKVVESLHQSDLEDEMTEVVIVDAIRTPVGVLGGILASVRPDDMAALVIKEIIQRSSLDPALVEEVFFGCANQAGEDNRNVARMASLLAGLPVEVGGVTVNRLCASGLNAVNQAARAIKAGEGDVYIAGGVESMSRAPYSLPKAESGYSFGNLTAYDTALGWRYPNPKMKETHGTDSMGETAENIAKERLHITREKQDAFALRSHQLAIAAIDSGRFKQEVLPVSIPQKKGDPKIVDTDERPRRDTTLESLAKLKPAFAKEGGTVTAGNSSGLNDGAAALLVMSEDKAKSLGLKPLVRVIRISLRRSPAAGDGTGSRTCDEESAPAGRSANEGHRSH
jgi:acetyl-CoA acetyltransferase family protein